MVYGASVEKAEQINHAEMAIVLVAENAEGRLLGILRSELVLPSDGSADQRMV